MNQNFNLKFRSATRAVATALATLGCAILLIACKRAPDPVAPISSAAPPATPKFYLGFDRNDYPGAAALPELRKTFSYTGYWLTPPPGERTTNWLGKREKLEAAGFGFLVLANGRLFKDLGSFARARQIGQRDSAAAAATARRERFPATTIIFLDQEQGGKLLPAQLAYLLAWVDGITAGGLHAGVYCSGIAAEQPDKSVVVTAENIREHAGSREITYWVYNDFCPPAPGCNFPQQPSSPSASGTKFADVWQFAESPREKDRTVKCAATYDPDGSCYAPGLKSAGIYVDLNFATSADPSHARH
jgi:Domain of unknown function (DUF1906)